MLGFCVLAPLSDAVAKMLTGQVPIPEIVLLRFAMQVVLLLPLVLRDGQGLRMSARVLRMTLLRTVLHIIGIALMFTALYYLPLADAVAIAFVMPLILLLLGHLLLGEEVGMRRLLACAVGFVGTLMVVQPAFRDVGWPALLPLGVALNFALFMLCTRTISREVGAVRLQAVSGLMAVPLILPFVWLMPGDFPPLAETVIWGQLLAIGVLGTLGHLLMTWSLRFAPGATLAPMQYIEIPVATVMGYIFFADLPDGLAAVGIGVTIACGLYIILRERAILRERTLALAEVPKAPPAAE